MASSDSGYREGGDGVQRFEEKAGLRRIWVEQTATATTGTWAALHMVRSCVFLLESCIMDVKGHGKFERVSPFTGGGDFSINKISRSSSSRPHFTVSGRSFAALVPNLTGSFESVATSRPDGGRAGGCRGSASVEHTANERLFVERCTKQNQRSWCKRSFTALREEAASRSRAIEIHHINEMELCRNVGSGEWQVTEMLLILSSFSGAVQYAWSPVICLRSSSKPSVKLKIAFVTDSMKSHDVDVREES